MHRIDRPRTIEGTLIHPHIGEAGRGFLANLLGQLTDQQLHDLFAVARVDRRSRRPGSDEPPASVDEWVQAFKQARGDREPPLRGLIQEIAAHRGGRSPV